MAAAGKVHCVSAETHPERRDSRQRHFQSVDIKALVYRYGLLSVLVLIILYFSWTQPFFGTFANAMFVLQAASVVAVVGLGVTVSMTVGGFDLSVGSAMSLSIMAAAAMVIGGWSGIAAIAVGLGAGVAVGLFNSFLIVYARIPDLVATLSTLFLVNGLTLLGVSGQSVATGMFFRGEQTTGEFAPLFRWLGRGDILGVPASVVLAGLIFIAVFVLLNFTRWGRAFYAVGGNPIAAAAAGIRVAHYRIAVCGRPPERNRESQKHRKPAVGRCRMSGLSDAALSAAGPHGVRGPDPNRLPGLEALRLCLVLPAPSFRLLPLRCPSLPAHSPGAAGSRPGGRGGRPEFSPSSVSSFFFPSSRHAALGRQTSFFTESAHTVRAILFARATAATLNGFSSIILRSQGSAISSRPL